MLSLKKLNTKVINNLEALNKNKHYSIIISILIFFIFLIIKFGTNINYYTNYQKDFFIWLNAKLATFPSIQHNLTQLGDLLYFLPLLTVFIIYAPKLWSTLLTTLITSLVFSASLKKLFAVPRPAAVFDNDSFIIIGKTLTGSTSLPSGHSIATFSVISLLLLSFYPKKNNSRAIWSFVLILFGTAMAFSRVGVGAHYPIDVMVGSALGYISAIIGIYLDNKFNLWRHIVSIKTYPIIGVLLLIWLYIIIRKTFVLNLTVNYLAMVGIVSTLFLMANIYVKKQN